MLNMRKRATGLALAAASLGGVGFTALATASPANAGWSWHWQHDSAHYKSKAQCLQTRSGVLYRINHAGPWYSKVLYAGNCNYNYSGHYWTYGHISYDTGALGNLWGGDHKIKYWSNVVKEPM